MSDRTYDPARYEGNNGGTIPQGVSDPTPESALPSAATTSAVSDLGLLNSADRQSALQIRQEQGWGTSFVPPVERADEHRLFRRICDDLSAEIGEIDDFLVDGRINEEGAGVMAEIQDHLERLYDCPFGQGESLKAIVVAIQSQISNAQWTTRHVEFLKAAVSFLRARWLTSDQMVADIDDLIEEHGLDVFRGTVSEPEVVSQYHIVKVPQS